ncbi:NAD-dependent epimerase/dehydratase family protein [Roseomonas haemaphysalidis]|nr:NAD-dependent epimerase/dehydratase family protein [Roseomonas haemaphysalidis]
MSEGLTIMATILVTGGCGFIGSHLCVALLARGDRVRVLDDLSTGSESNLAPGASLMIGDVARPDTVRQAMVGVDAVFHLAAVASVERGVQDPYGTHCVNLSATVAVLDAARHQGAPVVYASSAAVYGDATDLPLADTTATRPLSAYGADKLGCEQHARVAGHTHGVRTAGLRFFNVYGPRQDPRSPYSGVISIFCDRLAAGREVVVFGDGGQTRDFVYVGDVVRRLLAALPAASTAAPVFNVCTGQPTSVLQLAQTIAALCGQDARIRYDTPRAGEIRDSLGRPSPIAGLAEAPPVTLRDGLAETLAWLAAGRPGLSQKASPVPAFSA